MGAVTKAHAAHATALHDPAGSARTFLGEAALPAVRALNGAGSPALLPAEPRVVNAVRLWLVGPEVALYGYWTEWRTSDRSGRPPSTGELLRLTGEESVTSLHSSAPALLHALRMRHSMDTAPYLNQGQATYPGGVFELDAALDLPHPPDEDLEVGEVTIVVEGAGETPNRPRSTSLRRHQANPAVRRRVRGVPQRAHLVPRTPACYSPAPQLGRPAPVPPPIQDQGCPKQRAGPLARARGLPPAPPRRHDPLGPGPGSGGHPHPPLRGSACAPPPPPGA